MPDRDLSSENLVQATRTLLVRNECRHWWISLGVQRFHNSPLRYKQPTIITSRNIKQKKDERRERLNMFNLDEHEEEVGSISEGNFKVIQLDDNLTRSLNI